MNGNRKRTSQKLATLASEMLRKQNVSSKPKTLAASALAQVDPDKNTSVKVSQVASEVLTDKRFNVESKSLAASVLAQKRSFKKDK